MVTTETLDHLLAKVIAESVEDDVRLVYADALEESGDSDRAEFIRTQVRLAQCEVLEDMPCVAKCPYFQRRYLGDRRELRRLLKRERELLLANYARWSGNCIFTVLSSKWHYWSGDVAVFWRRGFISTVVCLPCQWVDSVGRHGILGCLVDSHPIRTVKAVSSPWPYPQWERVAVDIKSSRLCWFPGYQPVMVPYLLHPDQAVERIIVNLQHAYWPGVRFVEYY